MSFIRCLFGAFQIFSLPVLQQTWKSTITRFWQKDLNQFTVADQTPLGDWGREDVGAKIGETSFTKNAKTWFKTCEMKVEGTSTFLFFLGSGAFPKKVLNFLLFFADTMWSVRTWFVTSRSPMAFGNCAEPARRVIGPHGVLLRLCMKQFHFNEV